MKAAAVHELEMELENLNIFHMNQVFVNDSVIRKTAGGERLDHQLDQELESLVHVADKPDFAAGLEDFLAKRLARFAGG